MKFPVMILLAAGLTLSPCLKREDIKVLSAFVERILPGRQEEKPFSRYTLEVVTGRNADKMSFGSLWIDSIPCPLRIDNQSAEIMGAGFEKGDTLLLTAAHFHGLMHETSGKRPLVPSAMAGLSFPVLEYRVRDRIHYREIDFNRRPGNIYR